MKPESDTPVKTSPSKLSVFLKKLKRRLYLISFLIMISLCIHIYLKYFHTYGDGKVTGLLQTFSRKGTVFKTYEGEMLVGTFSQRNDLVIASDKFYFSVLDKTIASQLDTLQGRTVIVHYKQKKGTLLWKGETPYFVDSVKLR